MKTYICGHKNPDTDSVIAAIALAKYLGDEYVPARAGDLNKETEYILNRFGLDTPEQLPEKAVAVVLVDHNSPEEASELITPEKIRAVYDHHKLCGIFTNEAVPVRIEAVGSTCTIIAGLFEEKEIEITKSLAGALLCGILSDTLKFTSPTTTDKDKKMAGWLNETADIDVPKTAEAMFMAKSDISDIKTEDLLTKDYKVFEMSGQKVGVGVWETVIPEAVLARKEEFLKGLESEKQKSGLDYIFFAVIDILKPGAHFIILSDKEAEVAESVFAATLKDDIVYVPEVVSRKKQIIPPLEKYFS